jgi:hypothetical protein
VRRPLPLLLACLGAFGLALAQLRSLLGGTVPLLPGNPYHPDNLGNHWLLVWVAERLAAGRGLLHTDAYYWPVGDAPVLAGNGMEGALYLPFHLLFGWPAGFAGWALLVLSLNGLGGWALARAAGASPAAAWVALGLCGASPYFLQELGSGRFSQVDAGWLLLFLAAWLRFLARPSRGWALASAALLAVTAVFYWYYAWFGVMAGAVLWAASPRPPPARLALFSAAFLALIGPWAAAFAQRWASIPGTDELSAFPPEEARVDALSLGWTMPLLPGAGLHVGAIEPAPLLLLSLLGLSYFLWRSVRDPRPRGLLLVGLLFFALSLGPDGGLYTALYGLAAPLRRFWWPIRHIVVVHAILGVLGALLLDRLPGRALRRLGPLGAALALPALALQGLDTAAAVRPIDWPPADYLRLAALPDGVVLQTPLAPEATAGEEVLFFQMVHRKRLLGGHAQWVDRVRPPEWDRFVGANSFLSALQALERGEVVGEFRFDPASLTALREGGLRWVVLDRSLFTYDLAPLHKTEDRLWDALFGLPVYQGRGFGIWDMRQWTGRAELPLEPGFTWREGVERGGPTRPLIGGRPRSSTFDPRR